MILIPFLSLFLVSASGLKCYVCQNAKSLLECHSPNGGKVQECLPTQTACQTHVRRGSYGRLYEKRCKQRNACYNNQIQNPRPASHPSQCNKEGDTSVCRCCCFTDKCMSYEGCFEGPTPTRPPPDEFCKRPVICPLCTLNCGESADSFPLRHVCTYDCPPDAYRGRYPQSGNLTCRLGKLNGYKENIFLPPLPENCSQPINPNITCRDPPVWEDGNVTCHPPAPEGRGGGNWNISDTCDFTCPDNHTLVGDAVSVCDERTDPLTGEVTRSFEPQHPCCEPDCDPKKVADIVFVLDSSTSVGITYWPDVMKFVRNVTGAFNVGPDAVQFGVITFGKRVYDVASRIIKLNAAANSTQLEEELNGIKDFNSEGKGTATIEALVYTANNAFTSDFGHRANVTSKIVIFVTDGRSNKKYSGYTVKTASKKLEDSTTTIFSIGIGNQIKEKELETIAHPDNQTIIYDDFHTLEPKQITRYLQEIACEKICV